MARKRNYKLEYERRVQRGRARGVSRSQARGHPRIHEPHLSGKLQLSPYNRQLEEGLKAVRQGSPLRAAARSSHVGEDRLRRYMAQTGVVGKRGRRWFVGKDERVRQMPMYSKRKSIVVKVAGYEKAAEIGLYMETVQQFRKTGDIGLLEPYVGRSVTDDRGRRHPYETDPNILYKLHEPGGPSFEQVYRITQ